MDQQERVRARARNEMSGKYSGGNIRRAFDDAPIYRIACGRRVTCLIGHEGGGYVKAVAAEGARGRRVRDRVAEGAFAGTRPAVGGDLPGQLTFGAGRASKRPRNVPFLPQSFQGEPYPLFPED